MNKISTFAALKHSCAPVKPLTRWLPGYREYAVILCECQQRFVLPSMFVQRYTSGELFLVRKSMLSADTWILCDPRPGPEGQRNMTEAQRAESSLGCAQEQPLHVE